MLDEIQIRKIKRLIHDIYFICFKSFRHFFNLVNKCVILHKYEIWLSNFKQIIVQNFKIWVHEIAHFLSFEVFIQFLKIRFFIFSKSSSNHDADLFFLTTDCIISLFHFLCEYLNTQTRFFFDFFSIEHSFD